MFTTLQNPLIQAENSPHIMQKFSGTPIQSPSQNLGVQS